MDKEYLCKCNNCGSILFDENPQVGAPLHEAPKGTLHMEHFKDNSELHWGCPVCKTDEYLSDEIQNPTTVKEIEKLSNLTTKGDHTFGEIDLTALEGYNFGMNEKIRISQSFGGPVEVYIGWFNAISRTWPCDLYSFDTMPEAMRFISEQFEAATSS